jgi:hypothetical protein
LRIAEERARQEEERRMREEQLKTQKAIEKHNSLYKQGSTSAISQNATANPAKKELQVCLTNVSSLATVKPTAAVVKPQTENALNRTFNKDTPADS